VTLAGDDRTVDVRGTLGTVRNAVRLLDLLSEGPAFRQLSDIAESAGLSVPTVHRLLRSLVLADLVEQDPLTSRYGLGPELTRLSQRYLARLPILGALSPYLLSLRRSVDASIHVAILVRGSVVYVDHVEEAEPLHEFYRENVRDSPALSTASGRVLSARSDDDHWARSLELVDEAVRAEALEAHDSWASASYLVTTHHDGLLDEIAIPVLDAYGNPAAALAARTSHPTSADQIPAIVNQLHRAATAAARSLGHG
jgi:IclR family acetate operon transcriptional repressor